jgi:hypothetical protein
MKTIVTLSLIGACALSLPAHGQNTIRERIQARMQQIQSLRQNADDFYAAKERGDETAAMKAADSMKTTWQALPDTVRQRIESSHPGTTERVTNLSREYSATWTKDGNTVTRDGSTTGPKGNTATSHDTWTKNGSTVTHNGSTTGPKGGVTTRADTWSKDGNVVAHSGTTTGPRGGVVNQNETITRNGNTVTRQGNFTGQRGTASYSDDHDIFGNRPSTRAARSAAPSAGRGGRRR